MKGKRPGIYKAIKGSVPKKGTPKHAGDDMYKSYTHKNFRYDSDYNVKNGRLINNAAELETGIYKAAQKRKSEKNMKKIMQGVDAIRIAKMIDKQEGGL
tara:strand:- start:263 stop:559 length:297 start_codon:yes stop_codon:yes gene_type:complete